MKEILEFLVGFLMVLINLYVCIGAIYAVVMAHLAMNFSFREIFFRFCCWPWDLSNQIVARRKK